MPNLTFLADTVENRALLNPVFREALTMIVNIKKKYGIDYLDYDSLEEFENAYLSSVNTKTLRCMKHCLDSSGISDEVLDAVLEARLAETTTLATSI